MSNKLQKIISLAKKTGDRIVVFDNSEPDNSFVVMGLEEYEEILGLNEVKEENNNLTEDEIVDNINNSDNDKMWKNQQGFPKENIYSSGQVIKNKFKTNNNWNIPKSVKEAAEKNDDSGNSQ